MRKLLKNRLFRNKHAVIGIAVILILAIVLPLLLRGCGKSKQVDNATDPPAVTETENEVNIPNIKPGDGNSNTASTNSEGGIFLDVDGNPNRPSSTTGGASGCGSSNAGNAPANTQRPPSVIVEEATIPAETKDAQPNPQPPPDEIVVVSEGADSIPVNADKSIEKLQPEIGLLVGTNLENAGYNTLFMNAGLPRQMVEDAVKNYAQTGRVSLNPANYNLPALVGEYHVRLPVRGTNAPQAAKAISDHMRNDRAFNDKVATVFNQYKDGFLAVYQKDGYFYVLFAVIDKGYVN